MIAGNLLVCSSTGPTDSMSLTASTPLTAAVTA
jgi:hypothetical protein